MSIHFKMSFNFDLNLDLEIGLIIIFSVFLVFAGILSCIYIYCRKPCCKPYPRDRRNSVSPALNTISPVPSSVDTSMVQLQVDSYCILMRRSHSLTTLQNSDEPTSASATLRPPSYDDSNAQANCPTRQNVENQPSGTAMPSTGTTTNPPSYDECMLRY
jgi:hypothetical protein